MFFKLSNSEQQKIIFLIDIKNKLEIFDEKQMIFRCFLSRHRLQANYVNNKKNIYICIITLNDIFLDPYKRLSIYLFATFSYFYAALRFRRCIYLFSFIKRLTSCHKSNYWYLYCKYLLRL